MTIVLNGKRFFLRADAPDCVHFAYRSGRLCQCEAPSAAPLSHKGGGLTEIYADGIAFVIPQEKDPAVVQTMEALANPKTGATFPDVEVAYPMVPYEQAPWRTHNIVLVDNNAMRDEVGIRASLPIRMDARGFSYQGQYRACQYVIMQIIANPCNPRKSLLYVNTNHTKLLHKCLFTRQMGLPSYISGTHPYLNKVALLYLDGQYYGVAEEGAAIEAITNTSVN